MSVLQECDLELIFELFSIGFHFTLNERKKMKLLAVLFLLISYSTFGISKYQSQFFGEDSLQSNISNIIVTDMDGNEVKLSS